MPTNNHEEWAKPRAVRFCPDSFRCVKAYMMVNPGSTFNGAVRQLVLRGFGMHEKAEQLCLYERHDSGVHDAA
jgi:hypothetical protein